MDIRKGKWYISKESREDINFKNLPHKVKEHVVEFMTDLEYDWTTFAEPPGVVWFLAKIPVDDGGEEFTVQVCKVMWESDPILRSDIESGKLMSDFRTDIKEIVV